MGFFSNNMMSPSPECYTTFWMMTILSDTLRWSGITPILLIWTFLPNLTFYPIARGFHRTFQRVRHANRGRLLLRTPGSVPLWDLEVFLCWDQSLLNMSCFRTFEFRTSLGLSLLVCYVTCNDISVISVTAQMCRRTEKEVEVVRSGSQRHRHFAGFFYVPVIHRHGTNLFIQWFRHTVRIG